MVIRQPAVLSTLGPYFSKTTVYEPLNYWALPVGVRRKILEEYRITALYLDPAWTWEQRRGPLKAHAEALGIPADELQEGCTPGLYRISF